MLNATEREQWTVAELEAYLDELDDKVKMKEVYPGEEMAVFPDGTPAVVCTNGADIVAEEFGGVRKGFPPEATSATHIDTMDGHDFAIVDDRFIVDYWLKWVVGEKRGVYDLQDPNDEAEIKRIYGDRSEWE